MDTSDILLIIVAALFGALLLWGIYVFRGLPKFVKPKGNAKYSPRGRSKSPRNPRSPRVKTQYPRV